MSIMFEWGYKRISKRKVIKMKWVGWSCERGFHNLIVMGGQNK